MMIDIENLLLKKKRPRKRRPSVQSIFFKRKILFSRKRKRLYVEFTDTDFKLNLLDKMYTVIRSFAYFKKYYMYNYIDNKSFNLKWVEIYPNRSLRSFSENFFNYFYFNKFLYIKYIYESYFRIKKTKFFSKLNFFFLIKISPWPIFSSISLLNFVLFLTAYVHYHMSVYWFVILGILLINLSFYFWLKDIIRELVFLKFFSKLIRNNLKTGFWLFIVSELMFFIGFFWAFFHFAWEPDIQLSTIWPPFNGIQLNSLYIPTINTFFLLLSGVALNWVQYGVLAGSFKNVIFGFIYLFLFAFYFLFSQYSEYVFAFQQLNDSVFGSSMYMLTSFHGLHVLIGILMLIVCFIRFYLGHFTSTNYLGLVLAGWYWHFVDVIWIFVYIFIYLWGTWVPSDAIDVLISNFFWK